MKKLLQGIVALALIAGIVIADPFKTWSWTEVDTYENGTPIPSADVLSYDLMCGTTQGGPYDQYSALLGDAPPSLQDMGPLVQNTPGDYYCVATVTSLIHGTTSEASNEVNFTVLPSELGLRPNPTVLSLE